MNEWVLNLGLTQYIYIFCHWSQCRFIFSDLLNGVGKQTPWGWRWVQENQQVLSPSRSSSAWAKSLPGSGAAVCHLAPEPMSPCLSGGTPLLLPSSHNLAVWGLETEDQPCVCLGPESTTPWCRHQESSLGSPARAALRKRSLLVKSEKFGQELQHTHTTHQINWN